MTNRILHLSLAVFLCGFLPCLGLSADKAPSVKPKPKPVKHTLVTAKNGVPGYRDTPIQPWSTWHVHDPDRPEPKRIDPGRPGTQEQAGTAPSDAIVLFDGHNMDRWLPAEWTIEGGCLVAGKGNLVTKQQFGDCQLHVEWQTPDPPQGAAFNRGNNGVQFLSAIEVQIFDSYSQKLYADGQAASIYGQTPPPVNACRKPGQWQNYDIVFIAPRFNGAKLAQPARITLFHNGVLMHHNQEVYGSTGHAMVGTYEGLKPTGPITLLAHHNPVKFRNLWIRPLAASSLAAEKRPPQGPALVTVDPRVELFSIIFRLAGNNEYTQGRVASYTKDVDAHFGPFRKHRVVETAKRLRQTAGIGFDAPMSLAVLLTDAEKLQTKVPLEPWPESLDERWNVQRVADFLDAARQFVRDTSFAEFFKKHQPLYDIAKSRMQAVLATQGHLEWFDEFFGQRPAARFTVVLGMLNGGCCYGPHARTADGKEELYAVLGVWNTDADGKPQFTGQGVISTVIHEFCHSYTNGFVARHEAELKAAGQKLFAPVASAMRSQAYGGGQTVLCESLVRAAVVRHTRKYVGEDAARQEIKQQRSRQFACVEELSNLLGEYESHREQYPTLEAFAPRLVKFFNEYADKFSKEQKALAARRPKIVSIVPADGDRNVDPGLNAIRVVFDRPMRDKSWALVGGGPHFPEVFGECAYDAQCTTWTCPIKLKPDWDYVIRLNFGQYMAFVSQDGVPLDPVTVTFRTAKSAKPPAAKK
jgi:hypothetical protein